MASCGRFVGGRLNLLFVNYGDFTSNSLNHIGVFANRLTLLGHACVVAVPDNPETISVVHEPLFTPVTFARALEREPVFPNRQPADVVHAWTPRENIREFTLNYLRRAPSATLIIHLEDNEAFLIESYAHESFEALRLLSDEELAVRLSPRLSHPVRFRNFLRLAHGITYITDRLREFVPEGKPAHRLLPGIEPQLYRPQPADPALREELGIRSGEKLLVFTGSTTFANLADVRTLLLAVRLLNDRGTPCKLVRTGINPPELAGELAALGGSHVIDLGFQPKARLGQLLALADVLVQPGTADDFNDYRLPSKVPEFLSVGRPVVLAAANLAHEMEDGRHALLLTSGAPEEIAEKCLRVFDDSALARRLSDGALEFAKSHFEPNTNTSGLLGFYERVKPAAQPLFRDPATLASEDVLLADGDVALRMKAKEQTIAYNRRELAGRDTEIFRLNAVGTQQHEVISSLQAATTELRAHITTQQSAIVELQATVGRLNAALGDVQHQHQLSLHANDALRLQLSGSAAELEALKTALTQAIQQERDLRAQWAALQIAQARIVQEEIYLRSKLAAEQRELKVSAARINEGLETAARLARMLSDSRSQLHTYAAQLQRKDDKIQRMVASFSWQMTAPLRSLRRILIDPRRRLSTVAPSPAPAPEVDASLTYVIDQPTNWHDMAMEGVLRGWVISTSGREISAVRMRAGAMEFSATFGLSRPDVAAAFSSDPHAPTCGFVIDYVLPLETPQPITLEALTDEGLWRCFAAPVVRGAANQPELLRRDYGTWIKRFDTLIPERSVRQSLDVEQLPADQRPLISVVMPVYNTPEPWLVRAIESVRAQIYPHWELCIADDASSAPHVRVVLEKFARKDGRIKIVYRAENGHISAASNSALEVATGEFVALLDHDDEIAPHALLEVITLLAKHPATDFIYSDEDKIDEQGRRYDPYFKPDFLPDLFLAQNFTSHLTVYRLSVVREVGGFRPGFEGSQDWDLALRVADLIPPDRICHIPKVLYHWRAIPGSTALGLGEKNYPMLAARKALLEHFSRRQETVELIREVGDYWRVKRALPPEPPLVSLIIPTRNRVDLLSRCVGSLLANTTYPRFEIVIVDNCSDDPATLAYLQEIQSANVTVLRFEAPFNFSAINNFAVAHVRGTVLGLLNNDLEVINKDWLDEMVSHAIRQEIGCVGAMLYYPNDLIQQAGIVLGLGGVAGHAFCNYPRGTRHYFSRARLVQNYSAVTAACLVVRKEVYHQAGGFNERELAVAFNDVDFCLRVLKTGHRNLWTPYAEFYHHESASRGLEDTPEKLARFQAEVSYMRDVWGPLLDADPAYNPNLTLQQHDFSLSFPPR